jgi:hypothetical protein
MTGLGMAPSISSTRGVAIQVVVHHLVPLLSSTLTPCKCHKWLSLRLLYYFKLLWSTISHGDL